MTEDVTERCAACGVAPLHGRYCHACGQDAKARPQPLKEMVKEVAVSYSPVDGKLARTFFTLVAHPDRLLEAYRSGAGSRYVTPLKLFVAATALFLTVLNFTSTNFFQYTWKVEPGATPTVIVADDGVDLRVTGAVEEDRWLQPRIEPAVDPEIEAALEAAIETAQTPAARAAVVYEIAMNSEQERVAERLSNWLPNVLWLLMPLHALGLAALFGRRLLFLEHVIFAMWAHAMAFVSAMGIAALNGQGLNLSAGWVLAPYLTYFTVAAKSYYGVGWLSAGWRAILHTLGYTLFVLLPAAVIIYLTAVDWPTFWAWIES